MPDSNIATVLAAVIALGLALKAGVGPVVMYLTEAIKDALHPEPGAGGLISVAVGVILGSVIGALTAVVTADSSVVAYVGFGAIGGLFMAAGAVESHKAAGAVNTEASKAIQYEKEYQASIEAEPGVTPLPISFGLTVSPEEQLRSTRYVPEGEPDYREDGDTGFAPNQAGGFLMATETAPTVQPPQDAPVSA